MVATDHWVTRRTILASAAVVSVSMPAIVRVASLMPIRGLPLQLPNLERKVPKTLGEWYRLCFYHNLEQRLRAGRALTYGPVGGKAITAVEARQMVAQARARGLLPPLVDNG